MIDAIGDPALHILRFLDIDSLINAIKVNRSWRAAIFEFPTSTGLEPPPLEHSPMASSMNGVHEFVPPGRMEDTPIGIGMMASNEANPDRRHPLYL